LLLHGIGLVEGNYTFHSSLHPEYSHRRRVGWKVHAPRAQFSQPALYEIGSALTLFQVSNNAEEFLAALNGKPFKAVEVDAVSAAEIAVQAERRRRRFCYQAAQERFEWQASRSFCSG
jgi:restriction system protein